MASLKRLKRYGVIILIGVFVFIFVTHYMVNTQNNPMIDKTKHLPYKKDESTVYILSKNEVKIKKRCNHTACNCTKTTTTTKTPCDCTYSATKSTSQTTVNHTSPLASSSNYSAKYPFMLNCKTVHSKHTKNTTNYDDYIKEADKSTHQLRILRAVLVYFPVASIEYFEPEFRWLHRSWSYMQQFEPIKWRTDLIVFMDTTATSDFANPGFFLNQMNCTTRNKRTNPLQTPMCTLINYQALSSRTYINETVNSDVFSNLVNNVNIFEPSDTDFLTFLSYIKFNLATYSYLDSILMAYEGYFYFKSAGFDTLIRTDIDVFVTPGLAKWLPRNCNDFYVGGGGYGETFNRRRLHKVASYLGFKFAHRDNLGSTWISTPEQFRIVAYLTLASMALLAAEEFTTAEKLGKAGTLNWPEWHYGVLLLYGQNLAMNHLIGSGQLNVVALPELIDYPSANNRSVFQVLHVHVFHGEDFFSKFMFKMKRYDNVSLEDYDSRNMSRFYKYHLIQWFCLKMAMDGQRMSAFELNQMLFNETQLKN